jgi:hypothetical protein
MKKGINTSLNLIKITIQITIQIHIQLYNFYIL